MLYDRAQLDGDNSELDTLTRLALSHDGNVASLDNSEDTSPLPRFHFAAPLHAVTTTAVAPSGECNVKMESVSSGHPTSATNAKLLLIPGSVSAVMKRHSVSAQNLSSAHGGRKREPMTSGCGTPDPAKRRIQSDCGQKLAPLGDTMNVRSASVPEGQRSLVSLVPLKSAILPSNSEWNQQVRIKVEPGMSDPRAGKRKLPPVSGVFHFLCFLLE